MCVDRRAIWALLFLMLSVGIPGNAQQPRQYTKEDYARAERFMPYNVAPLAYQGMVRPR